VLVVLAWLQFIVVAMFSRATVKFVSGAEDWRPVASRVMQLGLMLGMAAMAALWGLAGVVAHLLGEPPLAWPLRLAAVDIPLFVLASLHMHALTGLGRFRYRALAGALRWVARLALIVLFVELGLSLAGAILGCIGSSVVVLMVCRAVCAPPVFRRPTFPASQLWSCVVPLFLAAVCLRVLDGLDLIALKLMGSPAEEAGVYAVAANLALLPGIISVGIGPVFLSALNRLRRAGRQAEAREMSRQMLRGLLLTLPAAAFVSGAAGEIVGLFFGPRFGASGPLLAVLILAGFARAVVTVAWAVFVASDKPRWTFYAVGPAVPLAAVGYVLLIPRFGPRGAAWVTAGVCGLSALCCVAAIRRLWHVVPPLGTVGRTALVCGLAYVLAAWWPTPGLLVLLKAFVGSGLTVMVFLLLGEFDAEQRALFRSMLFGGAAPAEGHDPPLAVPESPDPCPSEEA
jgi:O-antigen/teichoic acid export membrane protein